jgi:hypothetical protein
MKTLVVFGVLIGLACFGSAAAQTSAPTADTSAPRNAAVKSPHQMSAELAAGHNSFTQGQAQSRMVEAGYADVHDLFKDGSGLWQAKATKDGLPVKVALDYQGNVSSN